MAKKTYVVASEEGANYTQALLGEEVELDLEPDRELALTAAGWIEEPSKKKKEG